MERNSEEGNQESSLWRRHWGQSLRGKDMVWQRLEKVRG